MRLYSDDGNISLLRAIDPEDTASGRGIVFEVGLPDLQPVAF